MKKIFVSYAHADSQNAPNLPSLSLINALKSSDYDVWWDEDIRPGMKWATEITSNIEDAEIFLLFLSPNWIKSDYCVYEYILATKANCVILPVLIQKIKKWGKGSVKLAINEIQYLDVREEIELGEEAVLGKLLAAIANMGQASYSLPKGIERKISPLQAEKAWRIEHNFEVSQLPLLALIFVFGFSMIFAIAAIVFLVLNMLPSLTTGLAASPESTATYLPVEAVITEEAETSQTTSTMVATIESETLPSSTSTEVIPSPTTEPTLMPSATNPPTTEPTLIPSATALPSETPDSLTLAIERARTFSGTRNQDWEAFEHEFSDGHSMVLVPVGTFTFGNYDVQDESPANPTTIDMPFWIDRTEVSQAQYKKCTVCQRTDEFADSSQPVRNMSWDDANQYCQWRSSIAEATIVLPSEIQWEYAARGVESWEYPWQPPYDADMTRQAIYIENSSTGIADVTSYEQGASWVGALHMSGNVAEWTNSQYSDNYFSPLVTGRGGLMSYRGGSFADNLMALRASNRASGTPSSPNPTVGIRCIRSID